MFRKLWNRLFQAEKNSRKKVHRTTEAEEKLIQKAYLEMKTTNGYIQDSPKQLITIKDFAGYVNNVLNIDICYTTVRRIITNVRHQPALPGMEDYTHDVA